MIVISKPLVFPVLVIVWSMDAWLWLASIRLVLEKLSPGSQMTTSLIRLTDPLIKISGMLLSKYFKRELPQWSLWLVTFSTLIALRHILVLLIVSN